MARSRLMTGLLIAAGSAAVAIVLRRRSTGPEARVDVYYEDGSLVKLEAGALGSDRLLALAREALSAARPVL